MAATRQQVKVFMSQREQGKTQAAAAAKAGISERTGRRIEQEDFKPGPKTRHWRTRNDPFAAVWDDVVEQLGSHPELQALTLLEWLQDTYPGQYPDKLWKSHGHPKLRNLDEPTLNQPFLVIEIHAESSAWLAVGQ